MQKRIEGLKSERNKTQDDDDDDNDVDDLHASHRQDTLGAASAYTADAKGQRTLTECTRHHHSV